MKTRPNNTGSADLQKAARYLRKCEDELVRSYKKEGDAQKQSISFADAATFSAIGEKYQFYINSSRRDWPFKFQDPSSLIQLLRDLHGDWLAFPEVEQKTRRKEAEKLASLAVEIGAFVNNLPPQGDKSIWAFTVSELLAHLAKTCNIWPPEDLMKRFIKLLSQPVNGLGEGERDSIQWRDYAKPFISLPERRFVFSSFLYKHNFDVGHALGLALRGEYKKGESKELLGKSWELLLKLRLEIQNWKVEHEPNDDGAGKCDFRISDETGVLLIELKAARPAGTLTDQKYVRERQHEQGGTQLAKATDSDATKWLVSTACTDIANKSTPGEHEVVDAFWLLSFLLYEQHLTVSRLLAIYNHRHYGAPKPPPSKKLPNILLLVQGDPADFDMGVWERTGKAQPRDITYWNYDWIRPKK